MQPDHEPAALSKGRQINSERSIFTVLATWWCGPPVGEGSLLLGGASVITGTIPREASHPSCWSPLLLSSKMCPLLIDWRGLAGDFSCPVLQKELISLSFNKSLASNMKAGQSISQLLN